MWLKSFEYVRAESLDEAIQLLSDPDAKILAGGHSLLPAMKLRLSEPAKLVDIGRVPELKGISLNGALRIGALTTHAEIAASDKVRSACAVLAQTALLVGDPQVRNFGTLGGNIAHADPASDPPPALVAVDATIHLYGVEGARSVKAEDFFIDLFTTDMEPGELITAIEIPDHSAKHTAYVKMAHPASGYALVGVCVVLDMDGATCTGARVAVGGATAMAVRARGAEAALIGTVLDAAALDAAALAVQDDVDDAIMGDITFPEDYRQAMVGVYLKRAINAALD
jgi:aerobic carbon-monoxide dehydrogenase medium subunit